MSVNLFMGTAISDANVKEKDGNVQQKREKYSPNGEQDQ